MRGKSIILGDAIRTLLTARMTFFGGGGMRLSGPVRFNQLRRIAPFVCLLAALLMLPSCWTFSTNSLFDGAADPDLVFDQSLVGTWSVVRDNCELTLTMEASARAYAMKAACKGEKGGNDYWGYLVKLDNHRFLDITPGPEQIRACLLCLPVHTFALVSSENNNLVLTPLDGDWVFQSIKDKKVVVSHMGLDDGSDLDLTLTAQPAELKSFLRKYVNDKDAFKAQQSLIFSKK